MKTYLKFFAVIATVLAIFMLAGCSKLDNSVGPEVPDVPKDTVVTVRVLDGVINYTLSDNTIRFTGDFSAYPFVVMAGDKIPLDTIRVYGGKTMVPKLGYDHFNLLSFDKKKWYYKDMPGTNLTVTGAEWVVNGPNSWYWLHQKQANLDSWVEIAAVSPADVTITLDGNLWGASKRWVEANKSHVLKVFKDGYTSWEATFTNAPGETKSYMVALDPLTPPPPPAPYISENIIWDPVSKSDVFVLKTNVAGEKSDQITYLVLDGSEGPMLAINLFNGKVFKFKDNTTYYAGFDVVVVQNNDEFSLNLGQKFIKDYRYTRVTYIYGLEIVVSQWHYDGRFGYAKPSLQSIRLIDEIAGQWDGMVRHFEN
ncbi:MAG: hypothetical protein PHT40_01475 [Patescibacteria group bacterium]|nr:hypothetical protein [Patescibacteria group bacterium]